MDDIEQRMTEICLEALELTELSPDTDLVAAGMDSLAAVHIVGRLEDAYGVDVLETIIDEPTIAQVAAAIRAAVRQSEPQDA